MADYGVGALGGVVLIDPGTGLPYKAVGGGGGGGAVDSVNGKTGDVVLSASDVGAATTAQGAKADTAVQPAAIANFVPDTRTVAGKPLTADVTLARGDVGLGNVDNTSDAAKPVSTAQQSALDLKAPLASPAFTGTPTGITKAHVGLGNVDNTSDANKPVSTAQAAAINAKVGSGNASVTGIEYYPTVGDLPNPGVTGVIYATDSA